MASAGENSARCRITRQNSFSSRYQRTKTGSWKGVAASMTSPITQSAESPARDPLVNVEVASVAPSDPVPLSSMNMELNEVRTRLEEDSDRRKEAIARASALLSPATAGSSWTGVSSAITPQGAPSDERPVRRRVKANTVDVNGKKGVPVPAWMANSKENGCVQQAAIVGASKPVQQAPEPANEFSAAKVPTDVPATAEATGDTHSPELAREAMSGVGKLVAHQPDWVQAIVKATLCLCVKEP